MSRRQLIRTLYMGGQAAIGAELITVLGIFAFVFFSPDLVQATQTNRDLFEITQTMLDHFIENSVYYSLASVLTILLPTMAMLVVVWAWHLYFAAHEVYLMNWVASSVAIIGATLLFANFGISTWTFDLASQALENGHIRLEDAFMGVAIAEGLQFVGVMALYVFYPVLLSIASWRDRLLPKWFVALALALTVINDLHFVLGATLHWTAIAAQAVIVLWPFLMGVVLLLKARDLAQHDSQTPYTSAQATPTGQ